ncbi:hypothetical protein PY650_23175 [Rhizobium calliandrae]|uniref:Uncharacterized protein n=1 Tax=Rhizobium calliandrae TaxID=1312182 RepID=A0ABT7KIM8_9HYPH|nr:hypothetical protein [Rhizobium calliandrae]MDL2408494.1 hypothetical protein [Rhizobium calliandrae]
MSTDQLRSGFRGALLAMAGTALREASRLFNLMRARHIQRMAQRTLDEIATRFPAHLIDDLNARGLPPDRLWGARGPEPLCEAVVGEAKLAREHRAGEVADPTLHTVAFLERDVRRVLFLARECDDGADSSREEGLIPSYPDGSSSARIHASQISPLFINGQSRPGR